MFCALAASADYTITAASVVAGENSKTADLIAGETIAAGKIVFKDVTDSNSAKLANATNATKSVAYGIAMNGAADGQPVKVSYEDLALVIVGGFAVGDVIVLSSTDGGIAHATNVAQGWYPVVLGVATATNQLTFKVTRGTTVKP